MAYLINPKAASAGTSRARSASVTYPVTSSEHINTESRGPHPPKVDAYEAANSTGLERYGESLVQV